MDFVLETKDLEKTYGQHKVLQKVNMKVPKSSIYGLVGKNGAGKTTLMRVVSGLQKKIGGSYFLFGKGDGDRNIYRVRSRVGAIIEAPALFLDLSAEENLKMQYTILGLPSFSSIKETLCLVGLENTGRKKAGAFSRGMKERLGIAMALTGSPDLLFLDEPTNGLDPEAIVEMRELILRLNREKDITVVISSHILDELSRMATHYGFLDSGVMVKEISREDMEKECRKSLKVKVDSQEKASVVLDRLGISYSVQGNGYLSIYGEVDMGVLLKALEFSGIRDIEKRNETLEGYFMSVIGGRV